MRANDIQKRIRQLMAEYPDLPLVAFLDSIDPLPEGICAGIEKVEVDWFYEGDNGEMNLLGENPSQDDLFHAIGQRAIILHLS